MNNFVEQRKAFETKRNFTITKNITRVESREGKIEVFYNESDMSEVKGTNEYIEKYFPIVKASTLSLNDNFLNYEPNGRFQTNFKNALISVIHKRLKDFRAQRMDPCFDEAHNICFKAGMKPAIMNEGPYVWEKIAKEFLPRKGSRLGTATERIAFLGVLMKYLIEENGYDVRDAWEAVCGKKGNEIAHYYNSKNLKIESFMKELIEEKGYTMSEAMHAISGQDEKLTDYWNSKVIKDELDDTGSRKVGEWYDLGNTFKITLDDWSMGVWYTRGSNYEITESYKRINDPEYVSGYAVFGGYYTSASEYSSLAHMSIGRALSDSGVGWMVLSV